MGRKKKDPKNWRTPVHHRRYTVTLDDGQRVMFTPNNPFSATLVETESCWYELRKVRFADETRCYAIVVCDKDFPGCPAYYIVMHPEKGLVRPHEDRDLKRMGKTWDEVWEIQLEL